MNERIKQLAEQARQYAWVNETHWSAGPERERLFEQKFAELIVRECADVLLNWKGEPFPFDEDLAARLIKEHFGVNK